MYQTRLKFEIQKELELNTNLFLHGCHSHKCYTSCKSHEVITLINSGCCRQNFLILLSTCAFRHSDIADLNFPEQKNSHRIYWINAKMHFIKFENNFSGLDKGSRSLDCKTAPCLLITFIQARFPLQTQNTGFSACRKPVTSTVAPPMRNQA